MRTVTSPSAVAGFPLWWRRASAAVDRSEAFRLWKRPWFWKLTEPIFETIVAAVEIDQEAPLDNFIITHDRRRSLARVPRRGIFD